MSIDRAAVDKALAEMAQKSGEARSVGEAQKTQLAVIDTLLHPRSCFIAHYDQGRNLLNIAAVRGRNDPRIAAAHPSEGPVGRAFSSGLVVREDSLLAVPLQGKDGMLGVMVLISPRHELSDELLTSLATQVAVAAEAAKKRDESRAASRDADTAVQGLRSAEKKSDEVLGNISHELKNPLTTVKTYLAMLKRETYGSLNEKQARAVDICDRNADRLLRLINDLLLMSRLRGGEMRLNERPFGLKSLTDDVLMAHQRTAETAKVTLPPLRASEIFVRGDRERINEAIFNILEVAILGSRPDTQVKVTLETEEPSMAALTVTNEGEGMRPDVLQNLFDTFYRVRSTGQSLSGSGLGIPIAAKIVELHGGRLDVSSEPNKGTTFKILIPLFAGAVATPAASKGPKPGAILLVEDDQDCRTVLDEVLTGEGYPVVATASEDGAMEALKSMKPAMVLLDLRLADGDGRSILHHIRNSPDLAETLVYIVSGASDAAQLTTGTGQDRIDGLFEKPLQLTKLLGTVAALVRPQAS